MTPTTATQRGETRTDAEAGCPDCTDGLGRAVDVPHGGWRHRIRSSPGTAQAWRIGVFLAGALCVLVGVALAVLPGPLTIPPVLLGLWIWSTEFAWARRFFDTTKAKAKDAWAHARRHPVSSAVVTGGGLVLAAVAVWAAGHYDLAARAEDLVGL